MKTETRYIGTALDGPSLDPNPGLSVRGYDLNEMTGKLNFAEAIHHLLTGEVPSREQAEHLDRWMAATCRAVPSDHPAMQLILLAHKAGASWHAATQAGLTVEPPPGAPDPPALSDEHREAVRILAVLPRYVTAGVRGHDQVPPASDNVDQLYWLCTGKHLPDELHRKVLNNLLVSFHAGFGVVPPTVLVPRACAGTGVPMWQAVSAGFATSGPMHSGACEAHMAMMEELFKNPDPVKAGEELLERTLSQGKRMMGYGHPFFLADPRVPHIRALFREYGFESPYLQVYDRLQEIMRARLKIEPNLDAINSTTLLSLGIGAAYGSAVFLCSRPAAMVAHILERRNRPAFGTTSPNARAWYDKISLDWL